MARTPAQRAAGSKAPQAKLMPSSTEGLPTPSPTEFVHAVQPLLEADDVQGLERILAEVYPEQVICQLLAGPHADARKVAAFALAMVGTGDCMAALAEHLRDEDPMVNQMAEHALWSLWCRGGTCEANTHLARGSACVADRQFEQALAHFTAAIELCPDFAEAYNQRGMVHFLEDRYDEALVDCRRCLELLPLHFGAWAGLGHCYAECNELEKAVAAYRQALAINPQFDCIREMIEEIDQGNADDSVEPGPGCGWKWDDAS